MPTKYLNDIWMPELELTDYKVHFAVCNGDDQPLNVFQDDPERWQGWQEWRGTRNRWGNRRRIFSLIRYLPKGPEYWLFGGIWQIDRVRVDGYDVTLLDEFECKIGRLLLHSPYRGAYKYPNLENHYRQGYPLEAIRNLPEKYGPSRAILLRERLDVYYCDAGIHHTNFVCQHREECSAGSVVFGSPREAHVGQKYERCREEHLPRLLFVSSDRGGGPPYVGLLREEGTNEASVRSDTHWPRTIKVADCLFSRFRPPVACAYGDEYFAHTNSAKCCQNKPRNEQADDRLFDNCRKYCRNELEILDPDIVVSQGDKARDAVSASKEENTKEERVDDRGRLSWIRIGGRKVLWLKMYHPNQRSGLFRSTNTKTRLATFPQLEGGYADEIRRLLT